jgi:hypothetical protein
MSPNKQLPKLTPHHHQHHTTNPKQNTKHKYINHTLNPKPPSQKTLHHHKNKINPIQKIHQHTTKPKNAPAPQTTPNIHISKQPQNHQLHF